MSGAEQNAAAFPFAFGSLRNFDRAFAHNLVVVLIGLLVRCRVTNMGGLYGGHQSHLLAL